MNEINQKRKERIEDLLDYRLAEVADNAADAYYQSRDLANLTQAYLNIIRVMKEEEHV